MGNSNLVVNWMNGRSEVQKTQNLPDKTDIRPMAYHLDLFQHVNRDWNEEADRLTHGARKKAGIRSPWRKGQKLKLSERVLMEESAGKKIESNQT